MVRSVWWRHLGALVLVLTIGGPSIAWGQGALSKGSLVDYVRGREDLPNKDRRALEAAVRREFGGQALEEEARAVGKNTFVRSELQVAKAILSAAIFMQVDPKKAAKAAWEGWHDAQRYVPPPIAIHYQVLSLEGRRPRGPLHRSRLPLPGLLQRGDRPRAGGLLGRGAGGGADPGRRFDRNP
jgi:hypothetical protein